MSIADCLYFSIMKKKRNFNWKRELSICQSYWNAGQSPVKIILIYFARHRPYQVIGREGSVGWILRYLSTTSDL